MLFKNNISPFQKHILNRGRKYLIGCEVGVWQGTNAKHMLKNLDIRKLYLIDHYNGINREAEMTRKRLRKWQNKIIFLQKSSDEALKDIADNELDFCYIDGDHSYKQVKKDIENYYRKVKEGGILGGHDIDCGHSNGEKGVTKAVIEFCVENDFELNILGSDWWIEVK